MAKLRQKDRKILDKYDNYLHTAYFSNYVVRVPNKAVEELVEVWEYYYKKKYKLCTHCASSILNLCRELGKIKYKIEKELWEEKE